MQQSLFWKGFTNLRLLSNRGPTSILTRKISAGNYTETNQKVLTLPEDVGGSALELLLQGIYLQEVNFGKLFKAVQHSHCDFWLTCSLPPACGQIPFNKENVEEMLRISDRLQVIPVKDACAAWLERELEAFNVLEVLMM